MKKANYTYWINCKEWTFSETFFLVRGIEPVHWNKIGDDPSHELHAEWSAWIRWARRYCSFDSEFLLPGDWHEKTFPHEELLQWADSLQGVEVHEMWNESYKKELPGVKAEPGERAHENLMATIGILALALVEASGPETGSKNKPNISAIVRRCESIAGYPPGLAFATMRKRIKEGIHILLEKQEIAS